MAGPVLREWRANAPVAALVATGALALSLASTALLSGDVPRIAYIALGWVILSAAYIRVGKWVIDERGIRGAWQRRSWQDITSARVRYGQIELRGARRSLYLPNRAELRDALQACAPAEHPLRAALAQRPPQRIALLNVLAALLVLAVSAKIAMTAWLWFKYRGGPSSRRGRRTSFRSRAY